MSDSGNSVLIITNNYDPEYREFGDCAYQAIEHRPGIAMLKTCELEMGHDGPHEWDPDYVDPEDDDGGAEVDAL